MSVNPDQFAQNVCSCADICLFSSIQAYISRFQKRLPLHAVNTTSVLAELDTSFNLTESSLLGSSVVFECHSFKMQTLKGQIEAMYHRLI